MQVFRCFFFLRTQQTEVFSISDWFSHSLLDFSVNLILTVPTNSCQKQNIASKYTNIKIFDEMKPQQFNRPTKTGVSL